MDQATLDNAYDQRVWAPNFEQLAARRRFLNERARGRIERPARFQYGSSPVEGLNVYKAKRENAPVHVFIHGGAWRTGAAEDYAFIAEAFTGAGADLAILDFASVEMSEGDLSLLADQVQRGISWVYQNAKAAFGGDPDAIYLSGHSSGAHLAGCVLVTDWEARGLPTDLVKGAVLCSGMYDLKPVRLSKRSNYVQFNDEIEDALSAARHIDRLTVPVVIVYGSLETPEFQRQSCAFADAIKAKGKSAEIVQAETYNHFDMIELFANPYSVIGHAIRAQMKL
jgi:arylformamidase